MSMGIFSALCFRRAPRSIGDSFNPEPGGSTPGPTMTISGPITWKDGSWRWSSRERSPAHLPIPRLCTRRSAFETRWDKMGSINMELWEARESWRSWARIWASLRSLWRRGRRRRGACGTEEHRSIQRLWLPEQVVVVENELSSSIQRDWGAIQKIRHVDL